MVFLVISGLEGRAAIARERVATAAGLRWRRAGNFPQDVSDIIRGTAKMKPVVVVFVSTQRAAD